jgi:hypothetical protein
MDEKVKIVDRDGNEKHIYHLTGFKVYFRKQELVNKFSWLAENEA